MKEFLTCKCRVFAKSPDFAGDLPIFDKIMKISRFGMKISRLFTFANCVVIEKTQRVWFAAPGRRHIRRDTVVPHASEREAWLLRCA